MFVGISQETKKPAGQFTHGKNKFYSFYFSGKGIFMSHKFSHLRTKYFIGKNSDFSYTFCSYTFFSYTFFLLEHNGVLLEHNGVLLEHNGVLLEHNGVLLEHNGVFPEHNGVLLEQNAGWDKQKYEEKSDFA